MRFSLFCCCLIAAFYVTPDPVRGQTVQREDAKILAIGDSLMAWHTVSAASIAHVVGKELNEPVLNRAMGGAKIIHALPITGALGMKIASQFSSSAKERKDWVIMTGGGNDLVLGCGCNKCDRRMHRMIGPRGQVGEIPRLMSKIRQTGARVVYIGYLRSPGVDSVVDACLPLGNTLEARLSQMAAQDDGVFFVSLDGWTKSGDRSMHGVDMVHPSRKASKMIGKRVADVIRKADKTR